MFKKYVIERNIQGIGAQPMEALCGVALQSNNVLDELGTDIQWLHSYVTADKTYCVYMARDEALIHEHAKRSGFPANSVAEVKAVLDPTMAPA
ncbi:MULTISPECIES: DUF4242 domain-containing protein [Lysobacter]|uniref:DUF4242 domain-containing protein n=2 Tax=Lysobacter TaxID=68 RepID=A0A3D8VBD6_9GAMM|nr:MULTISPECIES: DUF4242 domain-containing protein [Lysobacter]RDY66585.1 DUF4242 domain-containing protein [Lysobacter soli]UTA55866.1 DUF4242 domain-containing protein [Lysobacter soli]BDU17317.1 DUF4242 domain-containing protein [Lysobacter auxotrophicus]